MKVLVVEDDENCVRFIEDALEGLCDVPPLTTGYLAGALDVAWPGLDAIWLDLVLLTTGAEEAIAAIPIFRTKSPLATLLVVSGSEHWREAALAAGADAFSTKMSLRGFNPKAVATLLSQAAVKAMERGVDASKILERVAAFVGAAGKPH